MDNSVHSLPSDSEGLIHRNLTKHWFVQVQRQTAGAGRNSYLCHSHCPIILIGKGHQRSCDNMAALNQTSKTRKRVSVGVKHSDLHHTIRTLKSLVKISFRYVHVKAHQDTVRPWRDLTLREQLNVICDGLANRAIKGYLERQSPRPRVTTLLPLEKAAVFIGNEKSTTDVGPNVRFLLGTKEARRFCTSPVTLIGGINKGGLGWSEERFNQVAWTELNGALHSKPDMYQLWLSKQCIGICAT